MNPRAVLISQWYPPEPVDLPESIAKAIVSQGWDVSVLTGVPNYPHGQVQEGYSSSRPSSEVIRAIPVRRAPLYPSHDASALRRFANYVSWALGGSLFGQGVVRRSDVALVYSSPATAALPAMVGKVLWGTPFVLLIQDVWPDSIFASGFVTGRGTRLVRSLVDRFVHRTYAMAAHVVVISPGMLHLLHERGIPMSKMSVVYNWLPDLAIGEGASLREVVKVPVESRVFLYAGNHGRAQALETLVDAFALPESGTAHLVMVGDGVAKESLIRRAAANPRVHFLEPVSRATAARLMATADATVVSLADEPLFSITMPSKVQSGLQAGVPTVVIARGDAAEVVERAGAGVSAEPGSPASIAAAVAKLSLSSDDELRGMGAAGAAAYESLMSERVGAPRLSSILTDAVRQTARTTLAVSPPTKGKST